MTPDIQFLFLLTAVMSFIAGGLVGASVLAWVSTRHADERERRALQESVRNQEAQLSKF